ncbi:OmpA family protein [Microlunatus ginsengisoli]|uniref:OmpA family protein n=1 Tax=Microlunatus ginsengisoli TaxID=363863 RepID=A0ABP7A7C6_9ACTN
MLFALALPGPAMAAPDPTAPVEVIVAPVVDIVTSSSDLGGVARVEQSRTSVRVTLDATVLFGRDSATLRRQARGRLHEVTATLRARGPGRVRIVGYTDDLGSAAHGLDLSRRRARAVGAVLRSDLPARTYPFIVLGRGEADPRVPNTSEANRRLNRRVVVSYQVG